MVITSVNNDKVKELVKLKDKKYRDKVGLFFVEGLDIVNEAYKNNKLVHLYILDGYDNPYLDIDTTYVNTDVMRKISDMESISGYYGVCANIDEKELGDKILILDNIQDPGNLGTIIRSAVAFKFDTIILSKDTVSLYNPKVIRSTKGMIFNINIIVRDIVDFTDKLDDYLICGTRVNDGIDIREMKLPKKLALVIGNEGKGIREEVIKRCDEYLYIEMDDKCESLNAAVASSILMYEVMKK